MTKDTKCAAMLQNLWVKSAIITKQLDNNLGAVHGIGFAEYMVLYHLVNAPAQFMRRIDLAEQMARSASGITRMLMPMEKMGLVEKAVNERDSRVSLVAITPAGAELFNNAASTLSGVAKHVCRNLDTAQADQLLVLLSQM